MNTTRNFFGFVGRFSLMHLMVYGLAATLFLFLQQELPEANRIALDFFQPYRSLNLIVILSQLIRGAIMALVLYPFYDIFMKGGRSWLILFASIWGLGLVGSVQPMPGSIEGMIYTETSLLEHVMMLIAGGIEALLLTGVFIRWETWIHRKETNQPVGGLRYE